MIEKNIVGTLFEGEPEKCKIIPVYFERCQKEDVKMLAPMIQHEIEKYLEKVRGLPIYRKYEKFNIHKFGSENVRTLLNEYYM